MHARAWGFVADRYEYQRKHEVPRQQVEDTDAPRWHAGTSRRHAGCRVGRNKDKGGHVVTDRLRRSKVKNGAEETRGKEAEQWHGVPDLGQ